MDYRAGAVLALNRGSSISVADRSDSNQHSNQRTVLPAVIPELLQLLNSCNSSPTDSPCSGSKALHGPG
jgi:hypothetical protein